MKKKIKIEQEPIISSVSTKKKTSRKALKSQIQEEPIIPSEQLENHTYDNATIKEEQNSSTLNSSSSISPIYWYYIIPNKQLSFYLLISFLGIFLFWISLSYLHSYLLALIILVGVIAIIWSSSKKQKLNFGFTEEHFSLGSQNIPWKNIQFIVFLPYHEDYLISLQPKTFPFIKMYIPIPKDRIQEITDFINAHHIIIKDYATETIIDRLLRYIIF